MCTYTQTPSITQPGAAAAHHVEQSASTSAVQSQYTQAAAQADAAQPDARTSDKQDAAAEAAALKQQLAQAQAQQVRLAE